MNDNTETMKILIIENEKLIADSLKKGLGYHRFNVDVAYNGKDGYLFTQQFKYDVIILDLNLPDISGEEICKLIRKDNDDVPILILSARMHLDDIITGFDYGADDYLTKPFEFSVLLSRMRALIRRKSEHEENILQVSDVKLSIDKGIIKKV